jgi:hypothetical protein
MLAKHRNQNQTATVHLFDNRYLADNRYVSLSHRPHKPNLRLPYHT